MFCTPWRCHPFGGYLCRGDNQLYPYADALEMQGLGSDADDALILAGRALLKFQNPYVQHTYLGNPISPGPGWALLSAPFGASGLYALYFPTTLALALWSLRSLGHDWLTLNRFVILLASSLFVWELAIVGNDYLPFAMLTLTAAVLLQQPALNTVQLLCLIVLIGLLSTCRIVFVFLPILIGFSLFSSFPFRAIAVGLGGLSLSAAITSVFVMRQPSYPPLDLLIEKAQATFSPEGLIVAVALCVRCCACHARQLANMAADHAPRSRTFRALDDRCGCRPAESTWKPARVGGCQLSRPSLTIDCASNFRRK